MALKGWPVGRGTGMVSGGELGPAALLVEVKDVSYGAGSGKLLKFVSKGIFTDRRRTYAGAGSTTAIFTME